MGSSKKHKDREHKRKHKHRSRSRSRERGERRRHRKEGDHDDRKRQKTHDLAADNLSYIDHLRKTREETRDVPQDVAPESHSGGAELSLTIEETNKLRAKLGLAPLEVDGYDKDENDKPGQQEDIHAPPINIGNQKKTEMLKEKMAAIREKRLLNKKLGKVKLLADSDSEEEDTAAWVRKNRRIQKDRELAEMRAKMLEEMDQEFGIGNLVEAEFGVDKPKEYTAKYLKGIKVEHAQDSFREGQTVILTLRDQGILDEDNTDTLINVNMIDEEKAAKNLENKKVRPEYKPYDEPEYDEYGMFKPKDILDKYDEEIVGIKKDTFQLGVGGKYDAEHERRMQEFKYAIKQQGQTLQLAPPTLASEYYSQTEMESFKKVKKKVRKVRKKALKANDLVPLEIGEDYGSRQRGRGAKADPSEWTVEQEEQFLYGDGPAPIKRELQDMEIDNTQMDESDILGPEEDLTGVEVEDDAALDLQRALDKARKLKVKQEPKIVSDMLIKKEVENEDSDNEESLAAVNMGLNITMNATSEFCRALGDIPTYGQAGNREEDQDDLMDFEQELIEERRRKAMLEEGGTGWQEVDIDTRPVNIKGEEAVVLDEEPVLNTGIGSALDLAKKKGYLEEENMHANYRTSQKAKELEAQNYSIEDKRYDDLDEKYRRKSGRYDGGMTVDFKEKDAYKPDIKLEYIDDQGRLLSQKEAFRQLSHRFHGKGSGKRKTEKRSKKFDEDMILKTMSSTDTPLHTVALLQDKQKLEKTPFIVLSGGNKGMTASSLTKT